MFRWFRKQGFWEWLAANTARIQASKDVASAEAEISEPFQRQYPGLVWEIGRKAEGRWDFCVSADGRREKFPDVERAVREAPQLPGWNVRAFRQRGALDVTLRMGAHTLG